MPLDILRDEIVRIAVPSRIVLFSQKTHPDGSPASVKLCVVIARGNPEDVEHRLYMEIDAGLAFDALVYTEEQWNRLCRTPFSLAARAEEHGRLLYEAE